MDMDFTGTPGTPGNVNVCLMAKVPSFELRKDFASKEDSFVATGRDGAIS